MLSPSPPSDVCQRPFTLPTCTRHSIRQRHRGAAACELAVVLPLLVTLCLLSVDFGRFAHDYLALSNAARTGADYGATHRRTQLTSASWNSAIQAAAEREMESVPGFDGTNLEVLVSSEPVSDSLERVNVEARYPFFTVIDWPGIARPLQLRRTVVVRQFR